MWTPKGSAEISFSIQAVAEPSGGPNLSAGLSAEFWLEHCWSTPRLSLEDAQSGVFDWESPTGNPPRDRQPCEFNLRKNFKKIDLDCVANATKVLLPDLSRKKANYKSICLVSRRFSDIACPILNSRIVLGGFTPFHRYKASQLKELSKGDNKASALAKHLSIDYSSSFPDDPAKVFTPLEDVMFKHLKSAIRSFRAITSVSWVLPEGASKYYIFDKNSLDGI